MGSFGVEILMNQAPLRLPTHSDVLENLRGILDSKCIGPCTISNNFPSGTGSTQDSRKRKAASNAMDLATQKRSAPSKRVRFSSISHYRVVVEHSNSNEYRMSHGEDEDSERERCIVPNPNDDEEGSDLDGEESGSLAIFSGSNGADDSDDGNSPSETSTRGANPSDGVEAQIEAFSTAPIPTEGGMRNDGDGAVDGISFEDSNIPTKVEDGPAISTVAAQV